MYSLRFYPDPILTTECDPLTKQSCPPNLRVCIETMRQIMHQKLGAGIAAPQVGWNARVFVVAGEILGGEDRVFINPRVTFSETFLHRADTCHVEGCEHEVKNERVTDTEGCLSIPKLFGPVERWNRVVVITGEEEGEEKQEETFVGTAARVIQHELDHLDGILFFDRMAPEDRVAIDRRLKKMVKKYQRGQN